MKRRAALLALAFVAAGCGGSGPADGRHFGYARAVRADVLEFDRAELLTGEEARRVAVEDGVIAPGDPIENDAYVRNPDRDVVSLPLAPDVAVTVVRCDAGCSEGNPGTVADLSADTQYWLRLRGGRAVAIDEQYLP